MCAQVDTGLLFDDVKDEMRAAVTMETCVHRPISAVSGLEPMPHCPSVMTGRTVGGVILAPKCRSMGTGTRCSKRLVRNAHEDLASRVTLEMHRAGRIVWRVLSLWAPPLGESRFWPMVMPDSHSIRHTTVEDYPARDGRLRSLRIEAPHLPRGGPVFAVSGLLACIALTHDGRGRLLAVSAWHGHPLGAFAGAAVPGARRSSEEKAEQAMPLALQVIELL